MDYKLTPAQQAAKDSAERKHRSNQYWLSLSKDDSMLFQPNHNHSLCRRHFIELDEAEESWVSFQRMKPRAIPLNWGRYAPYTADTMYAECKHSAIPIKNVVFVVFRYVQGWSDISAEAFNQYVLPLIRVYRFSPTGCRVSSVGFGVSPVIQKDKYSRLMHNRAVYGDNRMYGLDYFKTIEENNRPFWRAETLRGTASLLTEYRKGLKPFIAEVVTLLPLAEIVFEFLCNDAV